MSKSKGNVVDPFLLCGRYGTDAVRYYLLREVSFGQDCDYAAENLLLRYNTDLCNDLGNLVKRTTAMARQYFGGAVKKPKAGQGTEFDAGLVEKTNACYLETSAKIDRLEISRSLETVFELVGAANKYIDLTKPWALYKEGNTDALNAVLYRLLEAIRVSATLLLPFIRIAPQKIFGSLGLTVPVDFTEAKYGIVKEYRTTESEALFIRLDIKKELEELKTMKENGAKPAAEPKAVDTANVENSAAGLISIDEFFKTQLRVAEVKACEKVEKADKLLKLTLAVGGETRTVVSGIAMSYAPEELVGKRVVLVYNLKPAKLRGIESQGMILCAMQDGKPVLVSPEKLTDSGAEVC
jgi:methionyl-tRNA synthetase